MKRKTVALLFINLVAITILASLWYMGSQHSAQFASQNSSTSRAQNRLQTSQESAELEEYTTVFTPTLTSAVRDLPPADPATDIVLNREINPRFGLNDSVSDSNYVDGQPDILWLQNRDSTNSTALTSFTTPELNFAGIPSNGVSPPDTVGEVGPNHYVQMVNAPGGSTVVIHNKDGSVAQSAFDLDTLGSGVCANGLGDPIVLYDEAADRWFLSEFSANGTNRLCLYISQTADPTGAYYAYQYAAPAFPDYPKYGVWHDAYYVGANENGTIGATAAYAFDRTAMLAGQPATMIRLTAPDIWGGFDVMTPADVDGETEPPTNLPGLLIRQYDDELPSNPTPNSTEDYIQIWGFSPDFNTTANSHLTLLTSVPVAEFSSIICGGAVFCVPQPSSSVTLDTLREVMMWRVQYRNLGTYQTLIGNFVVDVDGNGRSAIRWFELRTNNAGDWELYQEGTFSPDTHHYWMGSAASDQDGNIALGYSVSSNTLFPSMGYTGRLADDTLGTMSQGTNRLATGVSSSTSGRWGDYSALSVDPVDDCTFWYTNMYATNSGTWNTQIASFKFPNCGANPAITVTAPQTQLSADTGSTVTYTLNMTNTGTAAGDFTLSVNSEWQATISPTSLNLSENQTATAVVSVTVPTTASNSSSAATQVSILNQATQETTTVDLVTSAKSFAGVTSESETNKTTVAGQAVTYSFQVTNTTSVTDTFSISVNSARTGTNTPWTAVLSQTSVTLGPNQTADITLEVTPSSDINDSSETFNVTVTSQTDASKIAVIPFITTVNTIVYLPFIVID